LLQGPYGVDALKMSPAVLMFLKHCRISYAADLLVLLSVFCSFAYSFW